jgi:hypothetical protein
VVAALQRSLHEADRQPIFLLKGGSYLELKLGLESRATSDVDLLFRGIFDDFVDPLDAALAEPWGELELSRSTIKNIERARRLVKPRRFSIQMSLRGKVWRKINVEVAPDEGGAGQRIDVLEGPPLSQFGLPSAHELAAITLDSQVAQKFHACTDPDDPPEFENVRARDLVDLLLVRRAFYDSADLIPLSGACRDIFAVRAAEALEQGHWPRPWPPTIVAHARWRDEYANLAEKVGIESPFDDAAAELNRWIAEIDAVAASGRS